MSMRAARVETTGTGQDSTFVLPDGTKICLDTEPNEHGWWFVVGVDVLFGYTRWHYGTGDTNGMHHDAEEWDAAHADASEDKSAGLFFLQSNGEWAKMNPDGSVTDVANESWKDYQATGDVTTGPAEAVGLTHAQWEALDQADQCESSRSTASTTRRVRRPEPAPASIDRTERFRGDFRSGFRCDFHSHFRTGMPRLALHRCVWLPACA